MSICAYKYIHMSRCSYVCVFLWVYACEHLQMQQAHACNTRCSWNVHNFPWCFINYKFCHYVRLIFTRFHYYLFISAAIDQICVNMYVCVCMACICAIFRVFISVCVCVQYCCEFLIAISVIIYNTLISNDALLITQLMTNCAR